MHHIIFVVRRLAGRGLGVSASQSESELGCLNPQILIFYGTFLWFLAPGTLEAAIEHSFVIMFQFFTFYILFPGFLVSF
jgi:hypothetical protein